MTASSRSVEISKREVPVDEMMRPPVNHAMRTLDRAFFRKTVPIAAARIFSNQHIALCRKELDKSEELLRHDKVNLVQPEPAGLEGAGHGRKCLLLRPEIMHNDASTWSDTLKSLESSKKIDVIPYDLQLTYNSWDYYDIMTSVLPPDEQTEVPSGFSIVGHVAHLNLRSQYLPYKHLIAAVLRDKNPQVTTVINKLDDVGAANIYRTFQYEVLAGEDDLNVEVKEEDCLFRFDYARVYWNPRLHAEHKRLVALFKEGEAVCDVMAGVGPFAVPAGRKKVFVAANDLNPDSYAALEDAVARNKVGEFVKPSNTDGRSFIVEATRELYHAPEQRKVEILGKPASRTSLTAPRERKVLKTLEQPRLFSHYVMNLPASALSFLPAFVGLYTRATIPRTASTPLPWVHVYCFSTKSDDNVEEGRLICEEISRLIGWVMRPAEEGQGEGEEQIGKGKVKITDVRDVAPKKRMFCASFRVPPDVLWGVPVEG